MTREKITVSLPAGVRARLKMIALLRSVSLQTLVSDVLISAVNEAIDNKGSLPPAADDRGDAEKKEEE